MKWSLGASAGDVVAGNGTRGNSSTQLDQPIHIVIDTNGYMDISDCHKHRILRLAPNLTIECIIAYGDRPGKGASELYYPRTLAFDREGSLYVREWENYRVQKFQIISADHESTSSYLTSMHLSTERINLHMNIYNNACYILQPCQNNGICNNIDSNQSYICPCASGFGVKRCELDHRPCKEYTCWNNGICTNISNTEFNCKCTKDWEVIHCERKKNYCYEGLSQNNGVCRPLLGNYTCACLGDSYYGRHCEFNRKKIVILKFVSKSYAYVAIVAMSIVAMFVIIMDILKYCFGIDPVHKEPERLRREKRKKKTQTCDPTICLC